MITHLLIQDAKIYTQTQDKHGDQDLSNAVDVKCKFRYITELDKTTVGEGLTASDAIIWFDPDVAVSEGSIILVDEGYWRVNRLIKARKMSSETVEFLKAFVVKHTV